MAIDQQMRVALYEACAGKSSMTVAELVVLLDGGSLPMIDQSMRIALYRTLGGFAGATVEDIVALNTGGPDPVPNTTRNFIGALEPKNFYTLSQEVGSVTFGDAGVLPIGIPIINTPLFANSIPMAIEPLTTAALFDGVNDQGINVNEVVDFDTGTVFVFFNIPATFPANEEIYGQQHSAGSTNFLLQLFITNQVRMIVSRDGSSTNFYRSIFDFSALLTFNTWHLLAVRQDGTGITWFFDNNFFTVADAEVTEETGGNLDNSAWSAETLVASLPANRLILGGNTAGTRFFTGQAFNLVNDDRVWTDTELTDLWNLAVLNGLS